MDVIIEAGCGTGNITRDVCLLLRYKKMISFDLSPQMIQFAETFNSSSSIEYKKSDLSADWDNIFNDLKQESTADLVFSIHCLHWISESLHNKAVANIRNMLKPGELIPIRKSWIADHMCTRSVDIFDTIFLEWPFTTSRTIDITSKMETLFPENGTYWFFKLPRGDERCKWSSKKKIISSVSNFRGTASRRTS